MIEAHNAIADLLDNRSLAEMRMLAKRGRCRGGGPCLKRDDFQVKLHTDVESRGLGCASAQ